MSEHPIQGLMNTALQNIREMVDVNTIIGDQIVTGDGTVIIPVSKVSLGFASGGSDFPSKSDKELFGGGSGAGASINPIAFIVVNNGNVKLLQIAPTSAADNVISLLPELIDKISSLFKDKKAKKDEKKAPAQQDAGADI